MKTSKTSFLMIAAAVAMMTSGAMAADHAIYTAGEKGAYNGTFCPPIPKALNDAYFTGYGCTPTKGTVENISNVLAAPSNIGMVQLDVYAKWAAENADQAAKLTVIRQDIACEGLWMVTKNERLNNFGDVLGLARRIPFVLPPEGSGSDASFAYLKTLDPDGLGRARNISNVDSAAAVIDAVANSSGGEVGFFVQFANPDNAIIKKIVESKLKVISVASREILRAKVGDQSLYQVSEFSLTKDGWVKGGQKVTTACTPVAIITGTPANFTDTNDQADQSDLIKVVGELQADKLLPQDDFMAKLIRSVHKLSGEAQEKLLAAVDVAKTEAMKHMN
jgi:hypothetical protein